MNISTLGEARFKSPIKYFINDNDRIPENIVINTVESKKNDLFFELAGARKNIYFDPEKTKAGIVTCGGLCPGLNDVIRSLFLELHYAYGVKEIVGFRGGYKGLDPHRGKEPLILNAEMVDDIHKKGGTFLGTSRGPVDIGLAVDNLIKREINILFVVGGDGTQKGGNELYKEARKRDYKLSVVGIPKTIDNDVPFVSQTFGYLTAIEEASIVLDRAHVEAKSVENGISLVKLMGRQAGFIAAGATLASQEVNFILVPEAPFKLHGPNGFLVALKKRIQNRAHALIVVAEGAGQDLMGDNEVKKNASGNIIYNDIGLYLREQIDRYFKSEQIPIVLRYIDPSYIIRSSPANAEDSIHCDLFARNAVHAAMAGKTGVVIGYLHDQFIHVPISLLANRKKMMNTNGTMWNGALASTGQPIKFE